MKTLTTPWQKMIGLMFTKSKEEAKFVFKSDVQCSIHTYFCRYPLDITFFDKDYKILERVILEPNKFYKPKNKFRYIVEIPC